MKTKEFFLQLKNLLNRNGGLLIVNLVCIYQSYLNVRQTIKFVFGEKNLITFRSTDFVNIVAVASSSIENFPTINYQSNIINNIQENLSIHLSSLLKTKQKQSNHENLSTNIYTDDIINIQSEEPLSLSQFINIV